MYQSDLMILIMLWKKSSSCLHFHSYPEGDLPWHPSCLTCFCFCLLYSEEFPESGLELGLNHRPFQLQTISSSQLPLPTTPQHLSWPCLPFLCPHAPESREQDAQPLLLRLLQQLPL